MKKKLLAFVVLLQVVLFVTGCATGTNPKYVFLFIGDGMGKPHVDLARVEYGPLNMDQLTVRGSVSTVNDEKKVTDSAASGTAYACGVKTRNGRLGIDAEGKNVDSCAVLAKRQGRRVAILTTVGANNATPAAFYAHVMGRGESKKIMAQFPESHIDILAGSGIDGMKKNVRQEDFLSGKAYQFKAPEGTADFNSKEVLVIAKKDEPFFAMEKLNQPVFVYSQGTDDLEKYVEKSIALMADCPEGFFMMAEGGHIDHGSHANDVGYMLDELQKFDKAVGAAIRFYKKHPRETLIIVSADHHTGGLKLEENIQKKFLRITPALMKISVEKDAADVILAKLTANGLTCTDAEKGHLHDIMKDKDASRKANNTRKFLSQVINRHIGLSWSTYGHTADEVYLFAMGKGAAQFAGSQENSDVGLKLKALFGAK